MPEAKRPVVSAPRLPGRHTMPDQRLSSLFVKRSGTAPATARSIGILSTYTPTRCGLASFAGSMRESLLLDRPDINVGIVRIAAEPGRSGKPEVVHELTVSDDAGAADKAAAEALNKFDVAVVQHEFGIFGGIAGEQVLRIMNWVRVPTIVVTHTVPANPSPSEEKVLLALTETADAIVAMSETARQRLVERFRVPLRKVIIIQHGAAATAVAGPVKTMPRRPTILSWGLLGPGKGIEWGIAAMPALSGLRPMPRYVVAGQIHPKVLANSGDDYRSQLVSQVDQLGVRDMVHFEAGYLTPEELRDLIRTADVVLVPYDSREQVTSGVLVEALAAQVPVVATGFPQAQELLAGDFGGLLVPHRDSDAIAAAITRILTEPGLSARLVSQTASLAGELSWSRVATQYRQLFDALLRRPTAVSR